SKNLLRIVQGRSSSVCPFYFPKWLAAPFRALFVLTVPGGAPILATSSALYDPCRVLSCASRFSAGTFGMVVTLSSSRGGAGRQESCRSADLRQRRRSRGTGLSMVSPGTRVSGKIGRRVAPPGV